VSLPLASARRLRKTIKENFGTLVFCRRYLERLGQERYLAGVRIATLITHSGSLAMLKNLQMNCLVSNGIVDAYTPLADTPGSYTAQFEHVSSPSTCSQIYNAVLIMILDSPFTRVAEGSLQSRR